MKRKTIAPLLALLLLLGGWASPALALSLDEAVNAIAAHMINDRPLRAPRNNIAVMKFSPVAGGETGMGDFLFRKIRIRMFEQDKARRLNFVAQGKVTDLLVREGIPNLSEVPDASRRVELGKLLTASHFIHGTYEIFQGNTVEIVGYLVDIKSGMILSQKVVTANNVPAYLLGEAQAGRAGSAKYKMSAGARVSHPQAAKLYRMAEILERRGRKEKSKQRRAQILVKFPDSLEALYIQIQNMTADTARMTRARQFDIGLYAAINAMPETYRKLPAYVRLDANKIQWVDTMVLLRAKQKAFDEPLFQSLKEIRHREWNTGAYRKLKTHLVDWLVALGDREIRKRGNLRKGKEFYAKAGLFPMDEDKRKWLADHVRSEEIRFSIRRGQKDQAEMALVTWETEEPDSTVVKQLWKELDLPAGMVNIPAGDVRGTPVNSFNLDVFETTNREFLEFVKVNPSFLKSKMDTARNDEDYLSRWNGDLSYATKYTNIPVVFVSQIVAKAYCKWKGKRLPSSLEWGLAAGQGNRKYPWGNKEPNDKIANFNTTMTFGNPKPGDSHPLGATPEGIMHMGGNVWELTSTIVGGEVVARGGSYFDRAEVISNDYSGVYSTDPLTYSSRFMGFRCAH